MATPSENSNRVHKVGLIAGNGQFPVLFAQAAQKLGMQVFAVAFKAQAGTDLLHHVDHQEWLYLGEVERIIAYFKSHGVRDVVFMGGIAKTQAFIDPHLDETAIKALEKLDSTRDDAIMRAFAGVLESQGLVVRASTWLLPELLAPAGCWTKRQPNQEEARDMALGYELAKKIGELDIGQCLVMGQGSVLAVEAIDGTDATILRGGQLGEGKAVVIKVKKPGQDDRFDLPAVGVDTIYSMLDAKATALGVDAGKAVVFDFDEMVALADEHSIAIMGLEKGA